MKKISKLSQHIFALITILLWSLAYVLTRIAVRFYTPESLSFLRYFIAAISLITFAAIKRMRLPATKDIPLFFLGGAIGFAVYIYVFNIGAKTVSASVSSFIISSSPVITAALAQIMLKEKIGVAGWISVVCAFIGVGVITLFSGGIALDVRVMLICLSAVLISLYNIFQRKLLARYSPLEITTYCIVSGAVLLSAFSPAAIPQLLSAPLSQIITIIVLGVFSAGIAYLCWSYALSKADKTSEVTNYMFLTPLITTILGYTMIGELPHISVYIGGGLVLLSVLLVNMRHTLLKK